ncbi:uncharacterized protein LOC115704137 [Cannabis sativa]|uniref:uncharacterized protein LOC115704137 n=1 Tax=Cannabis sativa TaxID=3483 RepID=UPI0029CAA6B2|nr:uncharacterized protein LOC115704137 [Cannabis sativa]
MTPIAAYLNTEELPDNSNEARKMRRKAARYIIVEGVMYRGGFSMPLLRCVTQEEAVRLLSEVHDGFCGNHAARHSFSKKILRQGYFWPTMTEDSKAYIVSDNGEQFDSQSFTDFCTNHGIIKSFSAVAHPQENDQVEQLSKTLKDTLKKRLEDAKGNWWEELPEVLWSYRTIEKIAIGQTPFAMAYGYEAMLPENSNHRPTKN